MNNVKKITPQKYKNLFNLFVVNQLNFLQKSKIGCGW